MTTMTFDQTLDARGLMCPMPLVKARQELKGMQIGQVLKIVATDKGSNKDFQGWARTAKDIELLAQSEEMEADKKIFLHFVRKVK
jgi:TusA-related sulfurtransferase